MVKRDAGIRKLSQNRAEETRKRILGYARGAFAEHGFTGANVRDIAKDAGTTHSMITYHFGTKDKLWRAAVSDMFDEIKRDVFDNSEPDNHLTARDRFEQFTRRYARYCAEHPEHARIMVAESIRGGERLDWMVENFVSHNHAAIIPMITVLIESGVLPKMPVQSFIYSYVAMLQLPFVLSNEAKALGYDFTSDEAIDRHTEAVIALLFAR